MPPAGSEGEEGPAAGGAGLGGGGPAGEQAGPGTPKLCGYLQKLSGKGPLRGFRSRWFVFDPRRCYLYYFKGPQEALPLGYLDIASACFSYHQPEAAAAATAAAGDEAAAFEVHSPNGAVAVLKVGPGGGRGGGLIPCPVPSRPVPSPQRRGDSPRGRWGGRRPPGAGPALAAGRPSAVCRGVVLKEKGSAIRAIPSLNFCYYFFSL